MNHLSSPVYEHIIAILKKDRVDLRVQKITIDFELKKHFWPMELKAEYGRQGNAEDLIGRLKKEQQLENKTGYLAVGIGLYGG